LGSVPGQQHAPFAIGGCLPRVVGVTEANNSWTQSSRPCRTLAATRPAGFERNRCCAVELRVVETQHSDAVQALEPLIYISRVGQDEAGPKLLRDRRASPRPYSQWNSGSVPQIQNPASFRTALRPHRSPRANGLQTTPRRHQNRNPVSLSGKLVTSTAGVQIDTQRYGALSHSSRGFSRLTMRQRQKARESHIADLRNPRGDVEHDAGEMSGETRRCSAVPRNSMPGSGPALVRSVPLRGPPQGVRDGRRLRPKGN